MEHRTIDFINGDFSTVEGFPHVTQQAVMPLVAYRGGGEEIRPLGTCFSISSHGLALTARHVVDEALNLGHWSDNDPYVYDQQWWLGALYVREPLPSDGDEFSDGLLPAQKLFGGLLPARKVHLCANLDMAVISLHLPTHIPTGKQMSVGQLRLRPSLPEVGLSCFGLGYHSMRSTVRPDTQYVVDHLQSYSATRGTVQEVHFPRRDNWLLPFPCFRTSARFDPGMSGGPIMDTTGNVVGMICSSHKTQEENDCISYGSLIGPSMLIPVEATLTSGEAKEVFLYDFAIGGAILLDTTRDDVTFVQEDARLTIDFGITPRISNVLGSQKNPEG